MATTQFPDTLLAQLRKLGLNVEQLETNGKLEMDWYTVTLDQKSNEKFVGTTTGLKAADLSIAVAKEMKTFLSGADSGMGGDPQFLRIWDNSSILARFNDDKTWS